jgi:hypothetical protein
MTSRSSGTLTMHPLGRYLLVMLLSLGTAAEAAVTASVDRNRITESDSLELILRASAGERLNQVDLAPLEGDFDVVSSSSSSRLSIINGKSERTTELKIVLLPRRSGLLLIPALTVGGQQTRSIAVEVSEAPAGLDSSSDLFVESEVDRDTAFVQSQLIHTFRIYEAVELVDRERSQLSISDAVVEELDAIQFQRTIDGRPYRVIEVRHAIFPQKSGQLTLPSMSFSGSKLLPRRSFFDNNVQTLRRRAPAITVEVKPIPPEYPDAPWIPASVLKLEESWSSLPEELSVGDSVTRTITLTAEGIDANQLPALEQLPVPGIKSYPDQPKAENSRSPNGITGVGTYSAALLLTEVGEVELPAIRVPWWDTSKNRVRYAEIPARSLRINPAVSAPEVVTSAPGAEASAAQADSASPAAGGISIWLWTTLAALLGWFGTTAWLLWRLPPRLSTPQADKTESSEPRLFREFASACNSNRPENARAALLQWAQSFMRTQTLPSVGQLRDWLGDEAVDQALETLERHLYSTYDASWSGEELLQAVKGRRKFDNDHQRVASAALPPLYSVSTHD